MRGAAMRRRVGALAVLALLVVAAPAHASVVRHGYLPLPDGTQLNYTLTLPSAEGRFPVVLQYDPYYAGATSDPTWNDSGYAMIGVNFRGTACSEGVFNPLRADIWGRDGAQVVDWIARQPWSDGSVGMIGYSFTGVSQLATAAYAGPALKAITPGNVFPDFYRDMIYPGGIHNGWIPLWIAARDYVLATQATAQAPSDPRCAADVAGHVMPNVLQTPSTAAHPYLDGFWSTQPMGLLDRVRVPVLGCVDWQDTTVYSRAFDVFRDELDQATTWVVGANGTHSDCPTSRARFVRFFDRYLKGRDNGWESTPHVVLVHEVTGAEGVRGKLGDDAGAWQTWFGTWRDFDAAVRPLALHLRAGGRMGLAPPATGERADDYAYPTPTANTPADFGGVQHWAPPPDPGGDLTYTTPRLAADAEFAGDGSADLWISSTATDTDVQIALSEVRPDGQEMYIANGWLRLSQRALDASRSTALRPFHMFLARDAAPLTPGRPVLARIHLLPFDHVFRAGSAIRLSVDSPGGYFQIIATPATNTVHHEPGMDSVLVLGRLPGATAHAPLPACGTLLNQPCRPNSVAAPQGRLVLPDPARLVLGAGRVLGGRVLRVGVAAAGGALRGVRLVLRDARGGRVGASRRFGLGERRRVVRVPVRRALRAGRYVLEGAGVDVDGGRVTATRALRVRRR